MSGGGGGAQTSFPQRLPVSAVGALHGDQVSTHQSQVKLNVFQWTQPVDKSSDVSLWTVAVFQLLQDYK